MFYLLIIINLIQLIASCVVRSYFYSVPIFTQLITYLTNSVSLRILSEKIIYDIVHLKISVETSVLL